MKTKIHLGARTFAVPSEIINLEAKVNYTLIHFVDDTKLLTATTIGTIEKRLQPYGFFRVNRSIVINLKHANRFSIVTKNSKFEHDSKKPAILLARRRIAAFEACLKA